MRDHLSASAVLARADRLRFRLRSWRRRRLGRVGDRERRRRFEPFLSLLILLGRRLVCRRVELERLLRLVERQRARGQPPRLDIFELGLLERTERGLEAERVPADVLLRARVDVRDLDLVQRDRLFDRVRRRVDEDQLPRRRERE